MHETTLLVLGLIGLLTIASLLLPIANRLNFPHTVLLAIAGCLLGGLLLTSAHTQPPGILGDFLAALAALDITSEAVFFIFLPALIFESALNINARHLLAELGPILLLAVIGLLLSTLLIGLAVWQVAEIGLVACLLLGAIVSATDPIAVVTIFKDLGAPKRLTILVEGESLFNDATAIVLFSLLAALLTGGDEVGLAAASIRFLGVFCGGILTGLVCAWLMAALIGRLRNLPLVETTLIICLAYLSFLLAEHYLHVSGVMAVVSAGLVMNSFGRTRVSAQSWHTLSETWEELVFWANSLIFFLVGLLVPKVLLAFSPAHALALLVLIVAAFVARACILYLVLPLLNRLGLGQRISLGFRTVMLWGGLRGAVSLALALVILETPTIPPQVQAFVVPLVTGFVLFTLFVNAPSMGLVLRFFGLDRLPPTEQLLRNRALALSLKHTGEGLARAAKAEDIAPPITTELADHYVKRLESLESRLTEVGPLPPAVIHSVGLTTLTNHERQLYLQRFAQGLGSAPVTRTLLARTDDLLDGLKTGGLEGYQAAWNGHLSFGPLFRAALLLQRAWGLTRLLARLLAHRFEVLRASESVVNSLISFNRRRIPALLGAELARTLAQHLERRLQATRQALEALRLQYPEYAQTLQRHHLARIALRLEEADYRRMHDEQMISQEVFQDLARTLQQRGRALDRQPRLDLRLEPARLVAAVPFFAELGPYRINEIARLLRPRLVVPGERILTRGEPGSAMYFISSGAVEVAASPVPIRLGSGDFFGELALLTQEPRSADVSAIAYCQLLVLPVHDFQPLVDSYPDLQQRITRVAAERLDPAILINRVPLFATLDQRQVAAIARLLKPYLAAPGERLVRQGEPGDAMYFIAAGTVEVATGPEAIRLGRGDFFGEVALLTAAPRNADVTATRYCQLLRLARDDFHRLLEAQPALKARITQVARQRRGQG